MLSKCSINQNLFSFTTGRRGRRPLRSVCEQGAINWDLSVPSPAGKGDRLRWMRRTVFVETIVFLNQISFVNIKKLLEK